MGKGGACEATLHGESYSTMLSTNIAPLKLLSAQEGKFPLAPNAHCRPSHDQLLLLKKKRKRCRIRLHVWFGPGHYAQQVHSLDP